MCISFPGFRFLEFYFVGFDFSVTINVFSPVHDLLVEVLKTSIKYIIKS